MALLSDPPERLVPGPKLALGGDGIVYQAEKPKLIAKSQIDSPSSSTAWRQRTSSSFACSTLPCIASDIGEHREDGRLEDRIPSDVRE